MAAGTGVGAEVYVVDVVCTVGAGWVSRGRGWEFTFRCMDGVVAVSGSHQQGAMVAHIWD